MQPTVEDNMVLSVLYHNAKQKVDLMVHVCPAYTAYSNVSADSAVGVASGLLLRSWWQLVVILIEVRVCVRCDVR